jgi:ABC-type sugar transport system ATPase subunit
MSYISLRNIITPYCLKNINLGIEKGELMVLLGFSGAGKSTLLNVIAGLTEYQGDVYFNQQNMNRIPTEKRDIGYLFQDIFLFPHLDTFNNIAFGLRATDCPSSEVNERVEDMLVLFRIGHLKNRYPKELSGGEKRRVGFARSLIMEPKILLMDEPLSSLDPVTARTLREEFKEIHCRLNLTTVYVTHDFTEARKLADRIVVLIDGEIKQKGTTQAIFGQPVSEIRQFIDG